ncbi:MAG: SIS domain-containing protein [Aerococcaceae bacterium]|nr:SIS domain-containing protein [Aerococcaceae bacterium]
MFELSKDQLLALGAEITTREIKQQPEIWREAADNFAEREAEVRAFLANIVEKHGSVRVIFTGAGTSAYVGETIVPYLKQRNNEKVYDFRAVPTTDIVSNPLSFFQADIPTLLVSFARSGNSPESVAAVQLAQQIVNDLYQLTITCAPEGALAKAAVGDDKNIVLLQPSRSNDAGFAMTGSFTCMMLTALLTFDSASTEEKASWIQAAITLGQNVIEREAEIQQYIDLDFDRVIYLGSGGFFGLAHEAQLKILELTAGQIATAFETSLGFRHGPKSFVNDKSLAFVFVSNDAYTRQYDVDIINELHGDQIAKLVLPIEITQPLSSNATPFAFDTAYSNVPDAYLAFPYILFGQTVSLLASIKVGNKPDTPSPTGTVNRVVKGVIIHPFSN